MVVDGQNTLYEIFEEYFYRTNNILNKLNVETFPTISFNAGLEINMYLLPLQTATTPKTNPLLSLCGTKIVHTGLKNKTN